MTIKQRPVVLTLELLTTEKLGDLRDRDILQRLFDKADADIVVVQAQCNVIRGEKDEG